MLLASFGIGGLLLADEALHLRADRQAGMTGLVKRAALLATVQAQALSDPLWKGDNETMAAALEALARDPDFASAQIVRPDGTVIRARAAPNAPAREYVHRVNIKHDVTHHEGGRTQILGELRLGLRSDRLEAALQREREERAPRLMLLLTAVLALLHVAFRNLAKPLDLLAGALGRLANGEQDVPIPGLHRRDEVGRVARGLQVFKDTAFQLARMQGEYRAIFDHAALGIYCFDPSGKSTYINAAVLAITGETNMATLQARLRAPSDQALYVDPGRWQKLARLLREEGGYAGQISELRRADGRLIWVVQTSRPVRDSSGRLLGHVGTVEDVTERHRHQAEERLRIRAAVESAGDAILIVDADGTPLFVNRAFSDVLGYDREALTQHGGVLPLVRESVASRRLALALRGGKCRLETDLIARDGHTIPVSISVSSIAGEHGEVVGGLVICTDLSHRRAAEARIAHMANHDSLTGLANRVAFGIRLEAVVGTSTSVAVLCLDLDRFKEVNETLGHAAGDQLLQHAAARIGAVVREGDCAARVGADEFIVMQRVSDVPATAERQGQRTRGVADT